MQIPKKTQLQNSSYNTQHNIQKTTRGVIILYILSQSSRLPRTKASLNPGLHRPDLRRPGPRHPDLPRPGHQNHFVVALLLDLDHPRAAAAATGLLFSYSSLCLSSGHLLLGPPPPRPEGAMPPLRRDLLPGDKSPAADPFLFFLARDRDSSS